MDPRKLTAADIDYDDAVRRCAGDAELYENLLRLMLDDTHMAQARAALEAGDYDTLYSHCHELKGMCGTVSFVKVYELSSEVVALYRASDFDAIPAVFDKMESAYQVAIAATREAME